MLIKNKVSKLTYQMAIAGAVLEVLYCLAIAWLLPNLGRFFGQTDSIFSFIIFLLLLVLSVSLSGLFIFGYPVYLGLKRELSQAVICLVVSLLTLLIAGLFFFTFFLI